MSRRSSLLVVFLAAMPAACLRVPGDLPDDPGGPHAPASSAAEVLAHHVEALGGEKKLRAIKARTVEARMVFRAQEGCEAGAEDCIAKDTTGSFLLQSTADGKLYRRTVLGELVEEKGFDGKTGWQLQGPALRIESEAEQKLSREDAMLHWYFDVDTRGIETTLVKARKEDSEGRTTTLEGIRWEMKGGEASPKTMWFQRDTGLLREEIVDEGEGDQRQRQTIVYDDYRDIDGVLVPFTVRVINEFGDTKQIVEFFTQRVDHKAIPAEKFGLPKIPDPEPVEDQWLSELRKTEAAAKAAPKDSAAQMAWTRAAFAAAHFDTAKRAAEAALAADSQEPEAMWTLARTQILAGEDDAANKNLARAARAGVRPEVLAIQHAWIDYRRRDFAKLAKDLDKAGNPTLAGRYRAFTGKPLQTTVKDCVTKLPMLVSEPLVVVEVELDGKKVGAIFDTGASDIIVPEKFAKEAGITVRAMSQMQEGVPNMGHGQAKALVVGSVSIANVPVDVFDDQAMKDMAGELADKASIVLGANLLADFLITVDVPGKKIELVSADKKCESERAARRKGTAVPFWLHETHFIYVLAKLEGAEGVYLVNTGMRGADMTATQQAYAHAGIGAPALHSDRAAMVDIEKFELAPELVFDKVGSAFGYFEQTQTGDGFRLDGMVGLGLLRRRAFTIDYDRRRLWFPAAQ